MIRTAVVAVALLAPLGVLPARAASPAVTELEKYLGDSEKAVLAGVLSDRAAAAEFEADMKFASGNPQLVKLVLDKWRGRMHDFAEANRRIGDPNLEGTYRNYAAMLAPTTRSYLMRRLPTMKEKDRNSLIEYLEAVNESLEDDGKLSWYTKKVVTGIHDKYREELSEYAASTLAQDGKRNGPAAAQALAAKRAEADAVARGEAERAERERLARERAETDRRAAQPGPKPEPKPGPKPEPAPDAQPDPAAEAPVASTPTAPGAPPDAADDALEQARRAAEAGERSGSHFDNSRPGSDDASVVAAPPPGRSGLGGPGLAPADPAGKPDLVADVPAPDDEMESFMSRVKKMKTGSGSVPLRKYAPPFIGAILGGILGFFLGGPAGAAIGAGLGMIAGDQVGARLFR